MATVYLHTGLPKTGTTALQNFLTDNDEILKRHGICYPDFGLRYHRVSWRRNARFLAAPYKDETGNMDSSRVCAEYDSVLDKIKELGKDFDNIFLTDEALWKDSHRRPDFWSKLYNDLKKRGLGLRVIVYLRPQDTFVQSLYRQKVKSAGTDLRFHDYLLSLASEDYSLDYLSYLDYITESVGKENLILRLYEKEQFQGTENNIFSDFLNIFGLSLSDGFMIKKAVYNVSLDGPWLEMRYLLNSLSIFRNRNSVLNKSMDYVQYSNPNVQDFKKYSLFNSEDHAAFLEHFSETNREIARNYLNRGDGNLFTDPPENLPEYRVDPEEMMRSMFLVCGESIELLEEENKKLLERIRQLEKYSFLFRLQRKIRHLFGRDKDA